jgi:PIN domain nuclease of toxin-antitoxin system
LWTADAWIRVQTRFTFLRLVLDARSVRVLQITPEIAAQSVSLGLHGDPADRLIAATAVVYRATLVTSDERLRGARLVPTLW